MKILNLYAGIGGNRKLWCDEYKIVAVEIDKEIAQIYHDLYPDDEVIVTDAHQFLLENFKKFDFIWSSPPCPSHSRLSWIYKYKKYPDMSLYQEIILLQGFSKDNKWVIENVIPYYNFLIKPQIILDKHAFWSNFYIPEKDLGLRRKNYRKMNINDLEKYYGISLQKYNLLRFKKRQLLRNCVHPLIGKYIFDCAFQKYKKLDFFNL
jgi:DNA (cytosine-5)-methyltransferase 1